MRRVLFVVVPPIQILDLTGPYEVFARCGGYKVELASSAKGPIRSSCGLTLGAAVSYREIRGSIDTLVIPGGEGAEELRCDDAFIAWLKGQAKKARRTCSICTGTFVLGRAGLLDGKRAVTHWAWCSRLEVQFPSIHVEQAPLYVKDGRMYTSGGIMAGVDLALGLVEEDHGPDRARQIARDLVMFLRRNGGQSQFSTLLSLQSASSRPIEELSGWIIDHLDGDLTVEALSDQCRMSPRHFARVFTKEKGTTPARFVQQVRVSAARALLEKPGASIKSVAALTGFDSADSMRRAFLRVLAITPREYVDRFGG